MSGAAAEDGASAGAGGKPERPPRDPGQGPRNGKKRGPSRGILITIIGALITAAIATAAVSPSLIGIRSSGPAGDAEPTLGALAPGDIAAAMPTLDPATSKAAVDDAKACKAPLGWVTLVKRPGSRGGMVRIRSGLLSIAAVPAHRGSSAHRHSLSGALSYWPWSPFARG